MNKTNVYLWFLSVAMLASNIFFIRYYVLHSTIELSIYFLIYLAVGGIFHVIITKKATHPTLGYTCVQALYFYIICKKNGITNEKDYNKRTNFNKIQEIAEKYDFSKNLDKQDLFDLFKNGENIYKK